MHDTQTNIKMKIKPNMLEICIKDISNNVSLTNNNLMAQSVRPWLGMISTVFIDLLVEPRRALGKSSTSHAGKYNPSNDKV